MIMQVMMLTTHDSSDYWLATIIMVLIVHRMEDSATHWIEDYLAAIRTWLYKENQ